MSPEDFGEVCNLVSNGNGAALLGFLRVAKKSTATLAWKYAIAQHEVAMAEAVAWNTGQVVGGNKEARDACVEGMVAKEKRAAIDFKYGLDSTRADEEVMEAALKLVTFQDRSPEIEEARQNHEELTRLRYENQQQAQELMDLAAKYDALFSVANAMDEQLSDEQRKLRDEGPFEHGL